ncbi:Phosphatidylinositol 4-kinase LSB6 [Sorochytrium milnesiophthora]
MADATPADDKHVGGLMPSPAPRPSSDAELEDDEEAADQTMLSISTADVLNAAAGSSDTGAGAGARASHESPAVVVVNVVEEELPSTDPHTRVLLRKTVFSSSDSYYLEVPEPTLQPVSDREFIDIVARVQQAIRADAQPMRIGQGSSGSYFCRDVDGQIVGVFKPKNEEPIHRNIFCCCFGRSCLVPNIGYLSEAAASTLDRRLGFHIVPRTEVIALASPAFYYPRSTYRRIRQRQKKGLSASLPAKVGSFQLFMRGFKDATAFLKEYPLQELDVAIGNTTTLVSTTTTTTTVTPAPVEEEQGRGRRGKGKGRESKTSRSIRLQQEQLEKNRRAVLRELKLRKQLDKGKEKSIEPLSSPSSIHFDLHEHGAGEEDEQVYDEQAGLMSHAAPLAGSAVTSHTSSPVVSPARSTMREHHVTFSDDPPSAPAATNVSVAASIWTPALFASFLEQFQRLVVLDYVMRNTDRGLDNWMIKYDAAAQSIHLAAIDNGLAFPFKHPDQWRSYPYGWLFLPIAKHPFVPQLREYLLSIFQSPVWWAETQREMRRLLSLDAQFDEDDFERQMGVMRGQVHNVVQLLMRGHRRRGSHDDNDGGGGLAPARRRGDSVASPYDLWFERPLVILETEEEVTVQSPSNGVTPATSRNVSPGGGAYDSDGSEYDSMDDDGYYDDGYEDDGGDGEYDPEARGLGLGESSLTHQAAHRSRSRSRSRQRRRTAGTLRALWERSKTRVRRGGKQFISRVRRIVVDTKARPWFRNW